MSKKELDIIWKKMHLVEEILEKHGKTVVKLIIYAVDCRRDIFEIIGTQNILMSIYNSKACMPVRERR